MCTILLCTSLLMSDFQEKVFRSQFLSGLDSSRECLNAFGCLAFAGIPLSCCDSFHFQLSWCSEHRNTKWLKCQQEVIYSCTVGRLITADWVEKKRGNLNLKFNDISNTMAVKLWPFIMWIPLEVHWFACSAFDGSSRVAFLFELAGIWWHQVLFCKYKAEPILNPHLVISVSG